MKLGVSDLVVDRGDTRVLDGVSATIEPGEFVGLVGPNGAGKTTLIHTLLGTITPTRGTARLGPDPVSTLSSREASRRVAAVPQRTNVSFEFTVEEVVGMGRHPHTPRLATDPDPHHVDDAMDHTNVAHLADRSIEDVSGGERQRVLLARALAQATPALLFDEPTASLDVNHQVRTLDLIAELATNGKTILAAIHDLNLAARYCDRLLLLADYEIVATGPPETVLTPDHVETAFDTRAIVRHDPLTAAPVVTALPDRGPDQDATVHVVGGGEPTARVVATLADAGFDVTTGIVTTGDAVTEVTTALDIETTTAPPFQPPSNATESRARTQASTAAVTVAVPSSTATSHPNQSVLEAAGTVIGLTDPDHPRLPGDIDAETDLDNLITTITETIAHPPQPAESQPVD